MQNIDENNIPKENFIHMSGNVLRVFNVNSILVELDNKIEITCHIMKKIKKFNLNIAAGDRVDVEINVFDLTKGKIINRYPKQ